MSSMEQFKTRERASEGKRLPLKTPDGKPTEHWLQVRHVWCDAFQEASEVSRRELNTWIATEVAALNLADDADLPKPLREQMARESRKARLKALATLVADWSFEEEATPENVLAFLMEAPQIVSAIDAFAVNAEDFFGNGSPSSLTGSEPKSA